MRRREASKQRIFGMKLHVVVRDGALPLVNFDRLLLGCTRRARGRPRIHSLIGTRRALS